VFRLVASLAVVVLVALAWFLFGTREEGGDRSQQQEQSAPIQQTTDVVPKPRKPSFDTR
jgi:hypothetical protein